MMICVNFVFISGKMSNTEMNIRSCYGFLKHNKARRMWWKKGNKMNSIQCVHFEFVNKIWFYDFPLMSIATFLSIWLHYLVRNLNTAQVRCKNKFVNAFLPPISYFANAFVYIVLVIPGVRYYRKKLFE